VSRVYLDTNFLYGHLRAPDAGGRAAFDIWRQRAIDEMADDPGVISALVVDELAYRLLLSWLRDDGDRDPLTTYRAEPSNVMRAMRRRLAGAWEAIDSLGLDLQVTDDTVVERAKVLMDRAGLAPRDAFHAAHALEAGCGAIVSSDRGFDRVDGLARVGP
jgi:predicted nucleic acid-binding protein